MTEIRKPAVADIVLIEGDDRYWSVNQVQEFTFADQIGEKWRAPFVEVQPLNSSEAPPMTVWVTMDKIRQVSGAMVELDEVAGWVARCPDTITFTEAANRLRRKYAFPRGPDG